MSCSGEKRKFASRRRSKKKFRGRRPGESDDLETIGIDQSVEGDEVRYLISFFSFLFRFYTIYKNKTMPISYKIKLHFLWFLGSLLRTPLA